MSAPPQDNPDKRPLPPGWVSQYNPNYRSWFYINTTVEPPVSTWVHPSDSPSQVPQAPASHYVPPPGGPPPPNYLSRPGPPQGYDQGPGYGYSGPQGGYNGHSGGYGSPSSAGPGSYNNPHGGYGRPPEEYHGGNYGQPQYGRYYTEGGYHQHPPSSERGGSYGRMFAGSGRHSPEYHSEPNHVVHQHQPPKKHGLSTGAKVALGAGGGLLGGALLEHAWEESREHAYEEGLDQGYVDGVVDTDYGFNDGGDGGW